MPNRHQPSTQHTVFKEDMVDYIPQNYREQLYSGFETTLSPNDLMQLIQVNGLKVSDLSGKFVVNRTLLNQVIEQTDAPLTLIKHISEWPQMLNWPQLNTQILDLIKFWLTDYVAEANIDQAHQIITSIEIEKETTEQSLTISYKFQLLLTQLLSRSTVEFDHYKFDYWQNFNMDTGLPNQQLLNNILDQILFNSPEENHDEGTQSKILADARSKPLGILVLNLNINFDEASKLNTTAIEVIKAAIKTIKNQLNHESILFQVSSYEFAILIKNLTFEEQIQVITSQLVYAFESTLALEKITLILKPYIGGASTFNPVTNALSLYEHARAALHQAMTHDMQVHIYEDTGATSFIDNHLLEEAVINALTNNELSTFLQPIVNVKNEVCETAEVLLRWTSADWPYVPPNKIVDIIDKKGFNKVFIRWLINSACQRSADLLFNHQRTVLLTINISVNDLLDPDLPEMIQQSIELWEIPAQNIVFEITETDLLLDESLIIPALNHIKNQGCQIALDDFGTGNSSMSRLREMPIDYVKIDQMFVRNILNSKEDLEIVQSIIKLAHGLDKKVVCEGVEDIGTVELLKDLKCEKIQGYFYSKPLAFDEFVDWLEAFEKTVTLAAKMRPPEKMQIIKNKPANKNIAPPA